MYLHAVTNAGSYDYSKPFKLFDESGDGVIPIDELRKMLYKLNIDSLLRENQVVELMNRFDTDRTGACLCIHEKYLELSLL
jgi:Ca2+-binding EF-hand superfamily protein